MNIETGTPIYDKLAAKRDSLDTKEVYTEPVPDVITNLASQAIVAQGDSLPRANEPRQISLDYISPSAIHIAGEINAALKDARHDINGQTFKAYAMGHSSFVASGELTRLLREVEVVSR